MTSNYFMGIDNGGSSTKCAIFDGSGRMVSCASARVPMRRGLGGKTERSSEDIWRANTSVIRRALADSGIHAEQLAGIGLCGYGGGLCLLDENGAPAAPFIVSTDSRAEGLLSEFVQSGVGARVYERTYQELWAGQPALLLPWLQREQPDVYARARHILTIKDYIRYRLTGEIAAEVTDASNTNLLSVREGVFDPALFDALGIPDCFSRFPARLLHPFELAGAVTAHAAAETGLAVGTPVAAGLYDVAACCLGCGVLNEDTLCLVVGTWSVCGCLTPRLEDGAGHCNTQRSCLEGYFFREESSPTSASNLDWFVEHFYSKLFSSAGGAIYQQCDALVSGLDPAESDLVFLPYLYGSNTVAGARASFFNLQGSHTAAHMLLAVYEGILFSLLHHVHTLFGTRQPPVARLCGGAARSAVWTQMLCDILGTPLEVMESSELGALGGAISAAVATGAYRDAASAVQEMCRVRAAYRPNPKMTELYQKKYESYRKAVKALAFFYND